MNLPSDKGVYVLIIDVKSQVSFSAGSLGAISLRKGLYTYVGSAKGPGGLRGRVLRHLRSDKKLRWHIDYLLAQPSVKVVKVLYAVTEEVRECDLVGELVRRGARAPVKGFGSSDCKRGCLAHLLILNEENDVAESFETLGLGYHIYEVKNTLGKRVREERK